MAAGMVTGKAWFKVPSAIKVEITGKKAPFISGKDVVLHLIGEIGVDGAYQSLEKIYRRWYCGAFYGRSAVHQQYGH